MRKHLLLAAGCAIALTMITRPGAGDDQFWVRPGVEPGGSGTQIDDPVPTIQEVIDRFEGPRCYVFLHPGVYTEDVVIESGSVWLRPVERYGGVTIEGSITIASEGVILRGFDFRSEGSAIILADGAGGVQILQSRILSVGEGEAGIEIIGENVANVFLGDNIVDLRDGEGEGRAGIRIHAAEGVSGIRAYHNQIAGCETGIAISAENGQTEGEFTLGSNRLIENAIGLEILAPGVTARRNSLLNNTVAGIHVGAGPTLIEANRMIGDEVAVISRAEGVDLTSNVIANPRSRAIEVQSGSALLLHNTIHADEDTEAPLIELAEGASARARHNIVSGPGELISVAGELNAFRNLFSHEAAVDDEGATVGDPGFVAAHNQDYRIRADSPAAHAAEAVEIDSDAAGIGRPWGIMASIGAYEVEGEPGREARTFYVAPGAEAGDGSRQQPLGAITEALAYVLPGETILVLPGECEPGEVRITRSGTPGAPITIRSERPHEAKMAATVFHLSNCSHVRIEGFDFTGFDGVRPIQCGAYVNHCEFVNNVFAREEEGGGAIGISGPGSTHNLIEGNRIALTRGGVGIQISCQRYNRHQTIRGNHISGCYYGVQTGGGSYPTAPPGYNVIEDNVFHENWKDGIHTKSTDDIIRNNHFHGNASYAITTREGARNVIVGNWIHDNGNGIRLHSPSHFVVNNVIFRNWGFGIYSHYTALQHYEQGYELWIAHNTIWRNGRDQVFLGYGAQAMVLRNIIAGADPNRHGIVRESGGVIRQADANLFFNLRPPLLREYEGGLHDRSLDPLLRDPEGGDLRPSAESPARDMPQLGDALAAVLSSAPAGVPLPDHIGSNLGPPPVN